MKQSSALMNANCSTEASAPARWPRASMPTSARRITIALSATTAAADAAVTIATKLRTSMTNVVDETSENGIA